MKNTFFIIFILVFISCSKGDDTNDNSSQINCTKLQVALVNDDSEALNFEINKLTQDLFPNPTSSDEFGHFDNFSTLIDRLNTNCPQIIATNFCYACIETFPVQSEIKIELNFVGNKIEKIIDISTPSDGILSSIRSHEPRSF